MKLRLKVSGADGPPESREWDLDADACALVTVDVDVFRKDFMTTGVQTNVRFYDLVGKKPAAAAEPSPICTCPFPRTNCPKCERDCPACRRAAGPPV